MAIQILGYIVFLVFNLVVVVRSQDQVCVQHVQTCAMEFQRSVGNSGGNVTETCRHVDEFIACLDRVLQPCDLATRTSLLSAMDNLIDSYERQPYNCNLESKENLTISQCTLQMGTCSAYDLQSKSNTGNPLQACSYHNIFKTCMVQNTTACNTTERVEIDTAISNSTSTMSECPFNCYGTNQCEVTTEIQPTSVEHSTRAFLDTGIQSSEAQPLLTGNPQSEMVGIQSSISTPSPPLSSSTQFTGELLQSTPSYQSSSSVVPFDVTESHQSTTVKPVEQLTSGSEGQQPTSGSEGQQPTSGSEGQQPTSGSEGQQPTSGSIIPQTTSGSETKQPNSGGETTVLYPYRNDTDMTFPSQSPKATTEKNWDSYGDNGVSVASASGTVIVALTLLSSLFV